MPTLDITLTAPPRIILTVDQVGHGFLVGNVVKVSGTNTYALAQADSQANSRAVGIVSQVVNADQFVLTEQGLLESGVPAVAAGTVMFLSDSVAGGLTSSEPTSNSTPILVVVENGLKAIVINSLHPTPGGGGGGVASVSGESVDNTDPLNPVVNAWPLAGTGTDLANGTIEVDPAFSGAIIEQIDSNKILSLKYTSGDEIAIKFDQSDIHSSMHSDVNGSNLIVYHDVYGGFGDMSVRHSAYSDYTNYPYTYFIADRRHQINGLGTPTVNDDNTLGFKFNSIWIYDGRLWICTDATTGAAVWNEVGASTGAAIVPITRVALQALLTGATADPNVIYRITDALTSTAVIDVFPVSSSALSGNAIDQTNNYFGFYNIVGDSWTNLYKANFTTLPLSEGGTNKNMTAVNGGVVYTDADSMEVTAAGTAGQKLQSNGAAAPTWVDVFDTVPQIGNLSNNAITAGATAYISAGATSTNAAESARAGVIPVTGTAKYLYLILGSTGQPAGQTLTVTLRYNGADTAVTFTVPAGSAAGSIHTSGALSVAVTQGVAYSIKLVQQAGANSGTIAAFGFNIERTA